MSFSSSHSIAFAKWVISKLPASISDDLVDNIDQTLWDEFLGTDEFKLVSKQNIDAIIPLLVEGITTKPSKPSKSTKPRKPTKIRSDAQTSTEDNDETNNIVIQVGVADDNTLPKVKKPRANKKQTQTQQIIPANDVDVEPVPMVEGDVVALTEGGEVQQAPQVPEPKVKKPRANKKLTQQIVTDTDGDVPVPVVEPKVKKPRVNKKLTQIVTATDGDVPVVEGVPEPAVEPVVEGVPEPVVEPVVEGVPEPVVECAVQQAPAVPEPKVKKPRANKKLMQIVPVAEEEGAVQQAPAVPEPKVKKPRANKKLMQIVTAAEEEGGGGEVQQAPAVPEPKVKKPRANKKQTQIVSDAIGDTDALLLDFNNLNISNNNDDIVVPVQEHLQLEHAREEIDDYNELVEDSYSEDEQQELTECFFDEVLFYTAEHGNWFDQQFQSIANPTI